MHSGHFRILHSFRRLRLSGEIVPLGKTVKSVGVRAHGCASSARLRRRREVKPDPTCLKPTRTTVSSAHKILRDYPVLDGGYRRPRCDYVPIWGQSRPNATAELAAVLRHPEVAEMMKTFHVQVVRISTR